ncbi:MAG TPA: hypothetical protein VF828_03190, partial [Patescibacteria group bacterium]
RLMAKPLTIGQILVAVLTLSSTSMTNLGVPPYSTAIALATCLSTTLPQLRPISNLRFEDDLAYQSLSARCQNKRLYASHPPRIGNLSGFPILPFGETGTPKKESKQI